MCKREGELVDHLLLHCKVSSQLWRVALNWFGGQWVVPGTEKEVCEVGLLKGEGTVCCPISNQVSHLEKRTRRTIEVAARLL